MRLQISNGNAVEFPKESDIDRTLNPNKNLNKTLPHFYQIDIQQFMYIMRRLI